MYGQTYNICRSKMYDNSTKDEREAFKYTIVRFLCNIWMYIISFKARLSQVKGTYYKPYSNHWKLKQRGIFNKPMKVKMLVT